MKTVILTLILCLAGGAWSFAGSSRAVIFCGLSGDKEHEEQFVASVKTIRESLTQRYGFSDSNVRVYFGRSEDAAEPTAFETSGICNREDIATAAKWLTKETAAEDRAWVFVIGHSYYDGKTVHFNIPDKDITHQQFCKSFKDLGGNSTFFICTPVSGFYIKGLSKPNRVVITSTEADMETNGSIYHTALAKTLAEFSNDTKFDIDGNGRVSWFDLYVQSTRELSDMYLNNEPPLIATEHPQLDDNGDGRGSELQIDYLTIAQGGRSDARRKRRVRKFSDGKRVASKPVIMKAAKPDKS